MRIRWLVPKYGGVPMSRKRGAERSHLGGAGLSREPVDTLASAHARRVFSVGPGTHTAQSV